MNAVAYTALCLLLIGTPLLTLPLLSSGQRVGIAVKDSIVTVKKSGGAKDSALRLASKAVAFIKHNVKNIKEKADSFTIASFELQKPLLAFSGGYVQYNGVYRSLIDTPFAENDIVQHTISVNTGFVLGRKIPFRVLGLLRQSNSLYFRNLYDFQVVYEASPIQQIAQANIKQQLLASIAGLKDSLTKKLYTLKEQALGKLVNMPGNPFTQQGLIEANENLKLSYVHTSDSVFDISHNKLMDSLQQQARIFIDNYGRYQQQLSVLKHQVDSLKEVVEKAESNYHHYRALIENGAGDYSVQKALQALPQTDKSLLKEAQHSHWLGGIQHFSLGRTAPNYSELTTRNINLRGIDVAYQYKWLYMAFTAGLVDYRFRDFIFSKNNAIQQYLVMGRLGVGRSADKPIVVSVYKGRKQLFNSVTTAAQKYRSVPVTGITLETKWRLTPHITLSGEAAQSVMANYRENPAGSTKPFSLSNKTAQAYALKAYAYIPATHTRLEGMYKYTGANFQSFSVMNTNTAAAQWYIKAEQYLWKRVLRLTASVRSTEFSNPYIQQRYNTQSIFTSISATLRARGLPVVSAGYVPVSQWVSAGNQLAEYRFQMLNVSVNHQYRLGTASGLSQLLYFKLLNKAVDTGNAFGNASNFYWTQQFNFRHFSSSFTYATQQNHQFSMETMEGAWQVQLLHRTTLKMGVRMINFNRKETKTGGFFNTQLLTGKWGMLQVGVDNGCLPTFNNKLSKNFTWNIGYTKTL